MDIGYICIYYFTENLRTNLFFRVMYKSSFGFIETDKGKSFWFDELVDFTSTCVNFPLVLRDPWEPFNQKFPILILFLTEDFLNPPIHRANLFFSKIMRYSMSYINTSCFWGAYMYHSNRWFLFCRL